MTAPRQDTHYVYVAYNAAGEVLYVGYTWNFDQRMRHHRAGSRWWRERARFEVFGPMQSRPALRLEDELIWTLAPVYNQPLSGDVDAFAANPKPVSSHGVSQGEPAGQSLGNR
jgi:hypothetical protein